MILINKKGINSKKATSIIEAIVVIIIISIGILGMFNVYMSAVKLSNTTSNRLTAIQIARDGIEGMQTIIGTNWIIYSSDYKNCWNVLNYDARCIFNNSNKYDIPIGSFYMFQDSDLRFKILSGATDVLYSMNYRDTFKVTLDLNGFYTQYGPGIVGSPTNPLFTREIKINYINTTGALIDSNDEKMVVTSLVQWQDSSSLKVHKVTLETNLSNWKK